MLIQYSVKHGKVNVDRQRACATSAPGGAIDAESGRSPIVLGGSGAKTANPIGLLPCADELLRKPATRMGLFQELVLAQRRPMRLTSRPEQEVKTR